MTADPLALAKSRALKTPRMNMVGKKIAAAMFGGGWRKSVAPPRRRAVAPLLAAGGPPIVPNVAKPKRAHKPMTGAAKAAFVKRMAAHKH